MSNCVDKSHMILNPPFDTYITNVLVLIVVKFKSNDIRADTTENNQYNFIRNKYGTSEVHFCGRQRSSLWLN